MADALLIGKRSSETVQVRNADAGGQQSDAANDRQLPRRNQHRGGDAKAVEKPGQKWKLLPHELASLALLHCGTLVNTPRNFS